ncbi:2-amino-4-hydroxy-6-hydroxymethyldihydropteridine diphosphokinase [Streptococcus caprae]|uniref:2-amino-4-hydroxy-6-hydroxymethyldihydropteridine diphosphokinase n=1 Tax=Streptococcus caprae TaxID=1640501 RepID=A0ABV8CWG4_9STRE
MTRAYLSLGTNMGDRLGYLQQAIDALDKHKRIQVTQVSSVYETPAWGNENQADFLNIACQIETDLTPLELLDACQTIEQELGRVRHEHWGPRTIDLDILLFGDRIIAEQRLQVPHPYMRERAFVLVPLLELDDQLCHPVTETLLLDDLAVLDQSQIKKLSDRVD